MLSNVKYNSPCSSKNTTTSKNNHFISKTFNLNIQTINFNVEPIKSDKDLKIYRYCFKFKRRLCLHRLLPMVGMKLIFFQYSIFPKYI